MHICLAHVLSSLPNGFDELAADAEADGHRHMSRLAMEFEDSPRTFPAIVAAYADGKLAGIGAITDEPTPTVQPVWRMRRLYVHRKYRRRGIARAIVLSILKIAANNVRMVTVHAGGDNAGRFWEAIGFARTSGKEWTHDFNTSKSHE